MRGRLKAEIEEGTLADALNPLMPGTYRHPIDKRVLYVYLDRKTETEDTVELVVVRKEQPLDEYDNQIVPDVRKIGCKVGDYWGR